MAFPWSYDRRPTKSRIDKKYEDMQLDGRSRAAPRGAREIEKREPSGGGAFSFHLFEDGDTIHEVYSSDSDCESDNTSDYRRFIRSQGLREEDYIDPVDGGFCMLPYPNFAYSLVGMDDMESKRGDSSVRDQVAKKDVILDKPIVETPTVRSYRIDTESDDQKKNWFELFKCKSHQSMEEDSVDTDSWGAPVRLVDRIEKSDGDRSKRRGSSPTDAEIIVNQNFESGYRGFDDCSSLSLGTAKSVVRQRHAARMTTRLPKTIPTTIPENYSLAKSVASSKLQIHGSKSVSSSKQHIYGPPVGCRSTDSIPFKRTASLRSVSSPPLTRSRTTSSLSTRTHISARSNPIGNFNKRRFRPPALTTALSDDSGRNSLSAETVYDEFGNDKDSWWQW